MLILRSVFQPAWGSGSNAPRGSRDAFYRFLGGFGVGTDSLEASECPDQCSLTSLITSDNVPPEWLNVILPFCLEQNSWRSEHNSSASIDNTSSIPFRNWPKDFLGDGARQGNSGEKPNQWFCFLRRTRISFFLSDLQNMFSKSSSEYTLTFLSLPLMLCWWYWTVLIEKLPSGHLGEFLCCFMVYDPPVQSSFWESLRGSNNIQTSSNWHQINPRYILNHRRERTDRPDANPQAAPKTDRKIRIKVLRNLVANLEARMARVINLLGRLQSFREHQKATTNFR